MGVNSLSAEMLLARFFSGATLSEYCVKRMAASGKGSESILAAVSRDDSDPIAGPPHRLRRHHHHHNQRIAKAWSKPTFTAVALTDGAVDGAVEGEGGGGAGGGGEVDSSSAPPKKKRKTNGKEKAGAGAGAAVVKKVVKKVANRAGADEEFDVAAFVQKGMAKMAAPTPIPGWSYMDVVAGTKGCAELGHSIHNMEDERLHDTALHERCAAWLPLALADLKSACKANKVSE